MVERTGRAIAAALALGALLGGWSCRAPEDVDTPTAAATERSPTAAASPSPSAPSATVTRWPTLTDPATATSSLVLPTTATPTQVPPTATATTAVPSPAPTATTQPMYGCDVLPEGAFLTIWRDNPRLRAALACPFSGHPRTEPMAWEVETAYQPFERGAMIWSSQIGWYPQPVIYVLHDDGTYERFRDTFDDETDPVQSGEKPPSGLEEPILGFGKVWREENGVRQSLGWASREEEPGPGRFQMFQGSGGGDGAMIWLSQVGRTYVMLPDGDFITLNTPTFE